jgi:hypothetical protein
MFAHDKWRAACRLLTDTRNVLSSLRMVYPRLSVVKPVVSIRDDNVTVLTPIPTHTCVFIADHVNAVRYDGRRLHSRVKYFVGLHDSTIVLGPLTPVPSWWPRLEHVAKIMADALGLKRAHIADASAWMCGCVVEVPRDAVKGAISVFKVLGHIGIVQCNACVEDLWFMRFLYRFVTCFDLPDLRCRSRHKQSQQFICALFKASRTPCEWALACVILRAFLRGDRDGVAYLMKGMKNINQNVYECALNTIHD